MTLEDETGVANIIVWPKIFERLRPIVIGARFVAVTGKLQNESGVIHVIAERMEDLTPMLGQLAMKGPKSTRSRPRTKCAAANAGRQKRQGNRFAQVQLPANSRAAPPAARAGRTATQLKRALPAGRNFH